MAAAKKTDTPTRKPLGPRPAYITYTLDEETGVPVPGFTTRKADEMLQYVDENPGTKYMRVMIK